MRGFKCPVNNKCFKVRLHSRACTAPNIINLLYCVDNLFVQLFIFSREQTKGYEFHSYPQMQLLTICWKTEFIYDTILNHNALFGTSLVVDIFLVSTNLFLNIALFAKTRFEMGLRWNVYLLWNLCVEIFYSSKVKALTTNVRGGARIGLHHWLIEICTNENGCFNCNFTHLYQKYNFYKIAHL